MQAPQRMQLSERRKVCCARMALRPLSTITTCSSPPRMGAVEVRAIGSDRLAGCTAREEAEKDAEIFCAGQDLFDAHAGDVDRGQAGAHVGVAFVRADDESAGFGDGEVDAGESGLSGHEFLAKMAARRLGEVLGVGGTLFGSEFLVEELADVLLFEVDGGEHDVAGRFMSELHDAFAEIGVGHLDATLLQVGIQVALLGQHRLRLHEVSDAAIREDAMDYGVVLGGIARPVDLDAVGDGVALELLQIIGEARERMHLDGSGGVAQHLPLRDAGGLTVTLEADEPQRIIVPVNPLIIEDEERRFVRVSGHESLAVSSISATCMTRTGIFSRRMMPSRCIRQETSKPVITSAPPCM